MLLMIDNYDSFTYNLVQYLMELGEDVKVERNDAISLDDNAHQRPSGIVNTPGPKTPAEAGISVPLVKRFAGEMPILGVCLGHQAVGVAFGGEMGSARRIMHGKTSAISHHGQGVFRGLPNPFEATRYHSLVLREPSLPDCLEVSAHSEDGEIMGLRHRTLPVEGIQFHPESILTPSGKDLLRNFLAICAGERGRA